jgi:REP element-mobilizing transposase RayT
LSTIVGAFKSAVTRCINRLRDTPGAPVWQRNFYERIVRHRREMDRIRTYIRQNPARWHGDRRHPIG